MYTARIWRVKKLCDMSNENKNNCDIRSESHPSKNDIHPISPHSGNTYQTTQVWESRKRLLECNYFYANKFSQWYDKKYIKTSEENCYIDLVMINIQCLHTEVVSIKASKWSVTRMKLVLSKQIFSAVDNYCIGLNVIYCAKMSSTVHETDNCRHYSYHILVRQTFDPIWYKLSWQTISRRWLDILGGRLW